MLQEYIEVINKLGIQFSEFDKLTGTGEISTYKLEEIIERTIDECGLQINKWNNIDGLESMAETYTKFRTVLRNGLQLINEIKQKQDVSDSLISVKNTIRECGQSLVQETIKVENTKVENIINDLTDKILLVEKEYNAGNLSIEKANKHIQKIKNTFKEYNIKTGDKTHDDNIDFLNYAIGESEKAFYTDTKIEIGETCETAEFLDSKSSEAIQDLTNDVVNLTNSISELAQELPRTNVQPSINLDTIYNKIVEISSSSSSGTRITNREMEQLIPLLDKEIDLMRAQVVNASISTTYSSELAKQVVSLAETLQEKSKKSTAEIVSNENVKRVSKISTQLDVLSDLSQESNVNYYDHINHLLVIQSNSCLQNNPELQTQINANYEKGRQIHISLAKTV